MHFPFYPSFSLFVQAYRCIMLDTYSCVGVSPIILVPKAQTLGDSSGRLMGIIILKFCVLIIIDLCLLYLRVHLLDIKSLVPIFFHSFLHIVNFPEYLNILFSRGIMLLLKSLMLICFFHQKLLAAVFPLFMTKSCIFL